MVMPGHFFHLMGLLPNIGDVMTSEMPLEYHPPKTTKACIIEMTLIRQVCELAAC